MTVSSSSSSQSTDSPFTIIMPDAEKGLERLEPWLDDGNIVLAVQGKYFRVHRSILGLYSEVFKDMFTIPHSDDVEEDLVDGCPVIHLQDAVDDVRIMLKALYDRSYVFFHDEPMPITVLAAFLRLGKKYAIGQLFREAVRRLSLDVPRLDCASNISTTGDMTLFPGVSGTDPHNFMIMNIASEIGHFSTVAMAVLYCCVACPALSIVDGYDFDGTRCALSFASQRYCLLGQRCLAEAQKQLSLTLTSIFIPQHRQCLAGLLTTSRSFQTYRGPFIAWQGTWDNGLCSSCSGDAKRRYEEARTGLWKDLPVHMGLGCWDDLDKDTEISW